MKINEIRPIEIRVSKTNYLGAEDKNEVLSQLKNIYEGRANYRTIQLNENFDLNEVRTILENEGLTVSNGISEGCYGARTGRQLEGLTCYAPLENFIEFFDLEYSQWAVNPLDLFYENGGTLLEYSNEFIENLLDFNYDLGIETKSDNSYNYEGHLENCYFMIDFNFEVLETENGAILFVRFHRGGDIRGNYTDYYAFKFDSIDDIHSSIWPYRYDITPEFKFYQWLEKFNYSDINILWSENENEDFSNDINGRCDFSGLHSTVIEVEYLDKNGEAVAFGKLDRTLCIAVENNDFSGLE